MTHHPDKAREAAALVIARDWLDDQGIHDLAQSDPSGMILDTTRRAIDAFLAASVPADEKIAEIRGRQELRLGNFPPEPYEGHSYMLFQEARKKYFSDVDELLTLVTALYAKQQDDKDEIARLNMSIELLSADKATFAKAYTDEKARADAQKAAHAKMLRDEADNWPEGSVESQVAEDFRRLADKIEGAAP